MNKNKGRKKDYTVYYFRFIIFWQTNMKLTKRRILSIEHDICVMFTQKKDILIIYLVDLRKMKYAIIKMVNKNRFKR